MIQTYLNGRALSDLHPSLNNQSKLDYFIRKSQRSQYPFGQNVLGVVHEFMKHNMSTDPYIRSIRKCINLLHECEINQLIYLLHLGFLDNGQYIVLCATKEQTKALTELTH